jgi:hypothetical protein
VRSNQISVCLRAYATLLIHITHREQCVSPQPSAQRQFLLSKCAAVSVDLKHISGVELDRNLSKYTNGQQADLLLRRGHMKIPQDLGDTFLEPPPPIGIDN